MYQNSERDLHGPAAIRTASGDILLCHQDSNKHLGGDGYVHQWRSRDDGVSWLDERAVADWRSRDRDALFAEYGSAGDGSLVMVVQRRKVVSDDDGIEDSWYSLSSDEGKSWQEVGPVDSDHRAFLSPRNVIYHQGLLFVTTWSPLGHGLYVSDDSGKSWQRRSIIFAADEPLFPQMAECGPPFYPHVCICADGSMLAMTYYTPPRNLCYSRRSHDGGYSWEAIKEEPALGVWAPRLRLWKDGLLVLTGRDYLQHATVISFSDDNGWSWSRPWILDQPRYTGSYAYTDSLVTKNGDLWVFSSSPQSKGRGDIISIRLQAVVV